MIDRFADWFAGVLLEKGVITEDELEVQVYGIQTILSNLLSYGVVLAVSWSDRERHGHSQFRTGAHQFYPK